MWILLYVYTLLSRQCQLKANWWRVSASLIQLNVDIIVSTKLRVSLKGKLDFTHSLSRKQIQLNFSLLIANDRIGVITLVFRSQQAIGSERLVVLSPLKWRALIELWLFMMMMIAENISRAFRMKRKSSRTELMPSNVQPLFKNYYSRR